MGWLSKTIRKVTKPIVKAVSSVSSDAGKVLSVVTGASVALVEAGEDVVSSAASGAVSVVEDVADNVVSLAEDSIGNVVSATEDTLGNIGTVVEDVGRDVVDFTVDIVEDGIDLIGKGVGWIYEDGLKPLGDVFTDTVDEVVEWLPEFGASLGGTLGSFFSEFGFGNLIWVVGIGGASYLVYSAIGTEGHDTPVGFNSVTSAYDDPNQKNFKF
jgi:hypothetical protein